MPATTATLRLEMAEDKADFRRWRFRLSVFLAFGLFVALSAFVQGQQTKMLVHPTGPLPAVNVP
jgi:hypothetical protein